MYLCHQAVKFGTGVKSRGGNGRSWKRCGLPSITGCKPTAISRPGKRRWALSPKVV